MNLYKKTKPFRSLLAGLLLALSGVHWFGLFNRANLYPHFSLYFAFTVKGVDAFIGRNYLIADSAAGEEEYLAAFLEMAVEPEDLAEPDGGEEEYLELFMAHSMEESGDFHEVMSSGSSGAGIEMKYSRFVSSYQQLDPGSGIGLIRLSSATLSTSGINVYSEDATLLCYSLLGEGEVVVNGRGIKCRKYDCVWLDCSRRLHYRASPGQVWECAFVRVQGRMSSHLFAETCRRLNEDGIIQLTFGAGSRFRSLIWQLLSARTDASPDPDSVFAHLLLSLFVEVDLAVVSTSAKQVIVPDIIVAIQSYLDRNYSRNISLDDLSHIFNISKFHMSREFKRYVGKSPNDYLIGIRLDKAKGLLVDSRRSIAEIGQLVGIPNTNHFLYLFKSREGITPSAFRKQRI